MVWMAEGDQQNGQNLRLRYQILCFQQLISLSLFLSLHLPISAPCCPPSIRTMAARWCGPTRRPAPPPLRASTGRYAVTRRPSAGAAWGPTPPTTTPSTMCGWSSTGKCPSSVEEEATGFEPAEAPCLWWAAAATPPSHWSAGGEGWSTTAMSSRPTRRTSCTTHHRPGGSNGSEYSSLFDIQWSSLGVAFIMGFLRLPVRLVQVLSLLHVANLIQLT